MDISYAESILGIEKMFATLEKDIKIKVKIPAGTENGKIFKIPSMGLPDKNGNRGSIYIEMHIVPPSHISEDEKKLYERILEIEQGRK